MSSNYSFDLVPENTLRMTISPLNNQYAIARLLDLDDVPERLKPETIAHFLKAVKQMGVIILAKAEPGYGIKRTHPDFVPREFLDALERCKVPSALIEQVELEYDPDRF